MVLAVESLDSFVSRKSAVSTASVKSNYEGQSRLYADFRDKLMRMVRRGIQSGLVVAALSFLVASGCGPASDAETCTIKSRSQTGKGSTGTALAFVPDPVIASGILNLHASLFTGESASSLDSYAVPVTLERLTGYGVLDGNYVSVRDGDRCNDDFGAESSTHDFSYEHGDSRFQEANAYVAGDGFRHALDQAGYLLPTSSLKVVAHCMDEDNAYYIRTRTRSGIVSGEVCLGDSVITPGASYADDGTVIVHELQHGTTADTYSMSSDFNQYWYDEAGALNEAISDFMAIVHYEPVTSAALDPRFFSRWALGTFMTKSYVRGAHRCPMYDATFPDCTGYALGGAGISAVSNRISYSYPDGMGWPYAQNYAAPYVKNAWETYLGREEIHNAATVMTGALWDMYQALKAENSDDEETAYRLSTQVTMEALKLLPKPSPMTFWSPITFRGYGQALVDAASLLGLTAAEQTAIQTALQQRGLHAGATLPGGWAEVGSGQLSTSPTPAPAPAPGVFIQDNPVILKTWLRDRGIESSKSSIVKQTSATVNGRLNPGEVVAIWFDIQNNSAITAGGLNIQLTSSSSDLTFVDYPYNLGSLTSTQAQIQYQKINGTDAVTGLTTGTTITSRNSYFGTNPYFQAGSNLTTAVFLRVAPGATGTKTITAVITPSNGTIETLNFEVTIH